MWRDALGDQPVTELGWLEWAERVKLFVTGPRRPLCDAAYKEIRDHLATVCRVQCVETDVPVPSMGPLAEADIEYGRCSVRLLDFASTTNVYLVLRRQPTGARMRWALLHELGHLVRHFPLLQSLGTMYHRICLDPVLEHYVGRAAASARPVREWLERQADLFALTWLLPTWLDDDNAIRAVEGLPTGLAPDGFRMYCLWRALNNIEPPPLTETLVARLNQMGDDERRALDEMRQVVTFRGHVARLLYGRPALAMPAVVEYWLQDYLTLLGNNPRAMPELRSRRVDRVPTTHPWIRRVTGTDLIRLVDAHQWAPLLVDPQDGSPRFHIPIRPVPSRHLRDSDAGWQHMMKRPTDLPQRLPEWVGRARESNAGLLVFPRNPAERAIDERGESRV
jgi:hypothetical protein